MEVTNHMNQIQIITDAGSDIIDCSRPDLTVLPMTIRFGEEEYLDGVNLTHKQFYEKMIETQVLPTTSQPSPYAFETAIRKIHQGDIALIITISSKLSGTWQSANIAAAETGGEVYIVDSLNVAVGEKAIVEYALRMKDAGALIEPVEVADALMYMLTRPRNVTIRDMIVLPSNFDV